MRRAFILFLPLALAACDPIFGPPPPPRLAGSGMDMFAPTKMRLHPLSRITYPAPPPPSPATAPSSQPATAPAGSNAAGSLPVPTLEARLELSDQFNDAGKGVGTISLQLFDQPAGGLIHKGALLASWSLSIDTPESNRDHWDRFSRTYLFKLPIPVTLPTGGGRQHLLLVATLTLPNGESLTDDIELPLK